ncbi:MAG TPA: adenylyl-sulfate kinase, partial [Pseudomonadales bacterium]|nr:adenylyl-sulfate kinase [Pseudomonadales bacterium]
MTLRDRDIVRKTLSSELDFSREHRNLNILRIGYVEVHVATPLEVREARVQKGLHAGARAGLIKEFTGISDPYEIREHATVRTDAADRSADEAAQQILL